MTENPASQGWHEPSPAGSPPPPPPPPRHGPPPLCRSLHDRRLAGVCGGLGAHFGVSPTLFRLGFVLLTFTGGLGLILYIIAVILIPDESQVAASPWMERRWYPGWAPDRQTVLTVLAAVLIIVAVSVLADSIGVDHGLVWGFGLVAVGVFLLVHERWQPVPSARPETPAPRPASASAATPAAYGGGAFAQSGAATAPLPSYSSSYSAPRPQRQRPVLLLATLASVLLAIGVATLLDSAGVVSVSVADGFAVALLIVGLGLVAGTWFGRSRALIAIGVMLVPCAALAALIDVPLAGGTGNVVDTPQTAAQLQPQYRLAAGQLTVDLSQLTLTGSRDLTATVAFGRLLVIVPPQSDVTIAAHDGIGQITLFGAADDGVNIDAQATQTPTPGAAVLHLTVGAGFGEVDVVSSANGSGGQ